MSNSDVAKEPGHSASHMQSHVPAVCAVAHTSAWHEALPIEYLCYTLTRVPPTTLRSYVVLYVNGTLQSAPPCVST